MPNIQRHLMNNLNWLDVMATESSKFKKGFRGMALTGWQRYDHFAILCELLPVSLPSLAINLVASEYGFFNSSVQGNVLKELECVGTHRHLEEPLDFNADPYLYERMSWCYFPGSSLFKMTRAVQNAEKDVNEFISKVRHQQAWLTDYNMRRNYSSPFRVDEALMTWIIHRNTIFDLIRSAKSALREVFDEFTVAEWIEQRIYPMYKQIMELKKQSDQLKAVPHWSRRPLMPLKELEEFGIGVDSDGEDNFGDEREKGSKFSNINDQTVRPKRLIQAPDFYRSPRKW